MKQEGSEFRSRLDIGTIRQVIRGALSGKVTLSPIEYDALSDPDDFAILVEKRGLASNAAFQLFVNDAGEERHITFVALGDGGFSTVVQAATTTGLNKGNVRIGKSRQLVSEMVTALQSQDPQLQQST
jgi:hypothetical protein